MIPELREKFNADFTDEKYSRFLQALESSVGAKIEFRPCETPIFLPADLLGEMMQSAQEIIAQLSTTEYFKTSSRAIPANFNAPNEGARPDFIQVDFAVIKDKGGKLTPKLIELQGCASLYAFQFLLPQVYQQVFDLNKLEYLFNSLTDRTYIDLFREVIVNGHSPEEVILMEIDPVHQKTRPDFIMTERLIGVPTVSVTDVIKRGNKLFYRRDRREVEIRRIYNRVIIDEFVSKNIRAEFDFRDELDVEWVGHPNWYFRISKFSLPFLRHPSVPRSWFLDQLTEYPEDLENFVLKPLFSFAGSGVKVNITKSDLDSISIDRRGDFLLQEKVSYAPVIRTFDEPSKVEVRLMFIWPGNPGDPGDPGDPGNPGNPGNPGDMDKPLAVTTLTRLSKGAMMGVDFNKNKTWVGSSCSFFREMQVLCE